MAKKKQTAKTEIVAEMPEGTQNVDQIRDILFGPQIRELEKSIARLEERLAKETSDLRSTFKQRLDALESFAKEEIEDEREARGSALDKLGRELASLTKDTDKRLTKLDEQARAARKELRKLVLEQSKKLGDEIQSTHDSLAEAVNTQVAELRADKADREALAALFTEVALRIKGESLLPGSE